ncbi:MAG: YbjQ family protein [Velocimicrobium sp.]
MNCVNCGHEFTEDMFIGGICFNCGYQIKESEKVYVAEKKQQQRILEQKKQETENEKLKQQKRILAEQATRFKNHMLTTGYDFDGFKIDNYLGLVSGETVIGTGYFSDVSASISDFFGASVPEYSDKIKLAKKAALMDMIKDSVALGGNSIIGISYEFMTFSRDMIGVSVNGTAAKAIAINEK